MANDFPKGGKRRVQTGAPKKFVPTNENQNKPKKHRPVHTKTAEFDFKESIEELAEEAKKSVRKEKEEKEEYPRKGRKRKAADEYIKHPRRPKEPEPKPAKSNGKAKKQTIKTDTAKASGSGKGKGSGKKAAAAKGKEKNIDKLRARYRSRMYRLGLNADYLPPAGSSEETYEEWFKNVKNHPDWVRDEATGNLKLKGGVPVASILSKATAMLDEFFDGISEHLYQPLETLYHNLTEDELRNILEKHGEEIADILTFLEKYPLKDLGDNPSADALREEILIKETELFEIFLNGEVMDMGKAYEISNSDDDAEL